MSNEQNAAIVQESLGLARELREGLPDMTVQELAVEVAVSFRSQIVWDSLIVSR